MPLIAFEGIDYSGKSTQIKLLSEFLRVNGIDPIVTREPGGTKLGDILRTVLLETKIPITNEAEILVFLASRAELVNQVIRPALSENKVVICDRFIDSSIAYQGYGRLLEYRKIFDLCIYATGGIVPDLTLFMDITPEQILERQSKDVDRKSFDRIEESGIDFYNRVYNGYCEWFKVSPYKSVRINANNHIMQVHNDIIQAIWKDNKGLL